VDGRSSVFWLVVAYGALLVVRPSTNARLFQAMAKRELGEHELPRPGFVIAAGVTLMAVGAWFIMMLP
jgi:hypothetical protein